MLYSLSPQFTYIHVLWFFRSFDDKDAKEPDWTQKDYEIVYDSIAPSHLMADLPQPSKPLRLKVAKLCHVTHKEQGKQIMTNTKKYHFKTNRKVGKSREERDIKHRCYYGESYHAKRIKLEIPSEYDTTYEPIPANREVFPGCYTWWGLYAENPPRGPQDTLPNYLKSPPESTYGSTAFVISFHDILESYASARSCSSREVCLRVGGTMRYKREIAYMIIVCTTSDEDLSRYNPVTSHDWPIDMQGLIDVNGIIVDSACVPLFTPKYYNKTISYETLNFAFYFPERRDFECSSGVICVKTIEHTGCIRTSRLKHLDRKTSKVNSYEICPYDIKDNHRYAHQKATEFES